MNDSLEQEIEGIVDRQLQDLGFIDLCTRIAQKVVERVQKIDEEHGIIKTELNDIEEKLNLILTDKKASDAKVVKRNVIVIDEEDEKPLLEKLQELSKTSQSLSGDLVSPKVQQDFQRDQVRSKSHTGHIELTSREGTSMMATEKTPIGSKRNSSTAESDISNTSLEPSGPKRLAPSSRLSEPLFSGSGSQTIKGIKEGPETKINSSNSYQNRSLYRATQKENSTGKIGSVSTTSQKSLHIKEQDSTKGGNTEGSSVLSRSKMGSPEGSARSLEKEQSLVSVEKPALTEVPLEGDVPDLNKDAADEDNFADENYDFKEGDSVLGKPEKSDIWYTAKITRVLVNKYGQKKYQVRFDSGQKMHGTLPGNNLAPIAHPKGNSLNVGSRVVAIRPRDTVDARIQKKYMTLNSLVMARGEILYGGVVVEKACEENRQRFLVFFDDGFAQYMTEKKIHLVIHSADLVWQDVSIHCREFIKEYLEEFPDRPMLKLKAGLTVQTEWNGKWLQAKVVAVDCSLVKMLFDVDKRTEWIYRGSTRLEPLYSELERRDLEALKNKNKKSSKKKKSLASTAKKVEPYVEDAITKPCFGISRFSKTDPEGIQQIKEWGPVEERSSAEASEQGQKLLIASLDNEQDSPLSAGKVRSDSDNKRQTLTKKRRTDESSGHGSDTSVDTNSTENEAGTSRNAGSNAMINSPSPKNSPQASARAFQRHSSQSSVESVASDSHLLLRNNKQGALERQLSSQSLQSESLNSRSRGAGFGRHKSSGTIGCEDRSKSVGTSVPVTRSKSMTQFSSPPNRSADGQLVTGIQLRNSTQDKLLITAPSRQRLILPRPPQPQVQYFNLAQSNGGQASKVLVPVVGRIGPTQGQTQSLTANHMLALINLTQSFPKIRGPHQCSAKCVPECFLPQSEKKKHNPLSVPLLLGWTRETAKRRPGYHRDIYYRAPCSKRLRNLSEVTKYLLQTEAKNVTIDEFSFDASISCRDQVPLFKTPRLKIDDISKGMERIPISCVNERNDELPPNVEYISERIIGLGIDMNRESGFIASCDCKDNCQDRSKCACARLTIDSSDAINGKRDEHCGYHYRRLKECVTTGIYECGRNCSCSATCYNKVVQNGIGARLQVFMTEDKGWGLRCLDDIPRGTFICTYSGQILNEEMADKEGKDFGDEYLAELDHIEIVEQAKEGYESDVPELRQEGKAERSLSSESSNKEYDSESDDSEFGYGSSSEASDSSNGGKLMPKASSSPPLQSPFKRPVTNQQLTAASGDVIDLTLESDAENEAESSQNPTSPLKEEEANASSSLDQMIKRLKTGVDFSGKMIDRIVALRKTVTERQKLQGTKDLPKNENSNEGVKSGDEAEATSSTPNAKPKFEIGGEDSDTDLKPVVQNKTEAATSNEEVKRDWNEEVKKAIETIGPKIRKAVARKSTRSILFQKLSKDEACRPESRVIESVARSDINQAFVSGKTFTSPRSSTGGHFARKSASHRIQITPPGQRQQQNQNEPQQEQNAAQDDKEVERKSTRLLYGEEQCYVIDAKSFGNVGRYLNHSCMPNLFVQNVFYDTHDLRFPLVAFFTQQNVPALTELTWDYSYDVGSVPGKVLECHCGSLECRGRLL